MKKGFITVLAITLGIMAASTVFAAEGEENPTENQWKFSGWAHSENTIGEVNSGKTSHEYILEARFTIEKQIREKLGFTYQLKTKQELDKENTEKTGTRLAYFKYTPDKDTTVLVGKNAYWMAGGLLMDDYIRGVSVDKKLGKDTNLWLLAGRYDGNGEEVITGASLTTKVSDVDLGLHYLSSNKTIQPEPNNYDGTTIVAVTAGKKLNRDLNLSVGYAQNTEDKWNTADDKNKTFKAQLAYKTVVKPGDTDLILQYWKVDKNMYWPVETGCHLTWYGDMYGEYGFNGYRLIADHKISQDTLLTVAYGNYKRNDNSGKTATKATAELAINF